MASSSMAPAALMSTSSSSVNLPKVLCCMCGVTMEPNKVNTCADCLKTRFDITSDFSKNAVLLKCKGCERYQKATAGWIYCAPESKALLAMCLKKIKGLQNVSLVDANFIWTEEHSKRIKVKVKVQKEVANHVVLQQTCVVEFVVQGRMCEDCHLNEANIGWNAVVQVRQKVKHKRTFLFLEQLILRHRESAKTINIEAKPEGVDFYFSAKNEAVRFIDFLEEVIPIRYKTSKKIVSQDIKSNVAVFNHTYSTEIVPICKDDVICLPRSTANKLGNISQIVVCSNVSNVLRLIDPVTCQISELTAERYWAKPFRALMSSPGLVALTVLDVQLQKAAITKSVAPEQPSGKTKKRRRKGKHSQTVLTDAGVNVSSNHGLALVEVARDEDFGVNDRRFTVLSHLGYVLKPGDSVLGYDMSRVNANDSDTADLRNDMPDIILIRKAYPRYRKAKAKRSWKLKTLVEGFENAQGDTENDREMFMRDLEEDPELRSRINLYKDDAIKQDNVEAKGLDIEEDAPVIGVENLLEDMHIEKAEEQVDIDDDL